MDLCVWGDVAVPSQMDIKVMEVNVQTPVIDFHNHAGRWTRAGMVDDPERFLNIMDSAGIDRACINCIYYGDARRANDIIARYCENIP